MDYDNTDIIFSHYGVPRGLGIYLDGNKSIKPSFGREATPRTKNRTTRRNTERSSRYSRKRHTK